MARRSANLSYSLLIPVPTSVSPPAVATTTAMMMAMRAKKETRAATPSIRIFGLDSRLARPVALPFSSASYTVEIVGHKEGEEKNGSRN